MRKRRHLDNKGVATIFSIIVATVVMVFCLALLLVSYTLYTSSLKVQNRSKCRASAVSMSEELKKSIADVSFSTYEEECEARDNGENSLWFYLRDNLNAEKWTSYKSGSIYTAHEVADRVFNISTDDQIEGLDTDTVVTMYWVCVADAPDESGLNGTDIGETNLSDTDTDYSDIMLYVRVESTMGDQKYSLTSCYSLDADETYETDAEAEYEKWIWQYEGRGEYDE